MNGAGSLTFYLEETYEMPKHPLKRVADSGVDESGGVVARKRMRSRKISKHGGGDLQLLASKEGGSGVWKGG